MKTVFKWKNYRKILPSRSKQRWIDSVENNSMELQDEEIITRYNVCGWMEIGIAVTVGLGGL